MMLVEIGLFTNGDRACLFSNNLKVNLFDKNSVRSINVKIDKARKVSKSKTFHV